ncbi:MAG TPA: mechanosensitive ion channel domain-containing protein [Phnomibacter sp.]|nr:mechanosensitive ion channel domain-containing protein [Phnomibacter sp.]
MTTIKYRDRQKLWCKRLKVTSFLLACLLTLFSGNLWAQQDSSVLVQDSAKTSGTVALDTFVYSHTRKLEAASKIFARWQSALVNIPDTIAIKKQLEQIDTNVNSLLSKLPNKQYLSNLRFLRGNLILTSLALKRLDEAEKQLKRSIALYLQCDQEVKETGFEQSFAAIPASNKKDSALVKQHTIISKTWYAMRQMSNQQIALLNTLQLNVTKSYIRTEFSHTMVLEGLKQFNKNLYSNPKPLISTPRNDSMYLAAKEEARVSMSFIKTMVQVFYRNNGPKLILNLFLFIAFLVIIFNNHKILMHETNNRSQALEMAPMIGTKPIGTALSIGFFISALLYQNTPAVIMEIIITGQMISISILLWRRVSKQLFWRWIALCLLFLRFGFMNLLVGISWEARWGLVSLNLGSIYIILSSYKIIRKESKLIGKNWIVLALVVLTSVQQALAVVFNIMGYPDAALVQSVNSIFNLAIAITILLTIRIMEEFLNMVDLRLYKHQLITDEEVGQLRQKVRGYLVLLGVVIWVLAFLNTLNYDKIILENLGAFLNEKQTFGSATFTYANLLTFALVFIASIWLSQVSSIIIDLFSTRYMAVSGDQRFKNGKLFLRLFILAAGIVIAFIASGIPAQQLTIILGALSVGIGLGLQQLVSNLVSGIIIAIEKPIKVGDVISIGNATGTISEVGLRSTIMTGKNGLKIYVPNGEFLSMPLFNQSTLKARRAIAINFLVSESTPLDKMRQLVKEALPATPEVMDHPPGEILLNASTEKGLQMTVYCWIARNASESTIRSAAYDNIVTRFQQAGIEFGSNSYSSRMNSDD